MKRATQQASKPVQKSSRKSQRGNSSGSALAGRRVRGPLGRRPKAEHNESTSERILDAAEELFAKHGLDGVTIKKVAHEAEVDTALLHYYFGNKQGLFDKVFGRRAEIANRMRMESLDEYQRTAGKAMTIEGTVDAFVGPLVQLAANGGPGWRNYFALTAQANNTPEWGGATMTRYFDPVIQRFIELLGKVMPSASKEDLYWCFHMLTGAITLTMSQTGRIDRLSGGLCQSNDLHAAYARMVPYTAAGFREVCAAKSARKRDAVKKAPRTTAS